MNDLFAYTDALKMSKAKQIVERIMSSPAWKDVMGGDVGVVVNEEAEEFEVDANLLNQIELPNIASFEMCGEMPCNADAPAQFLGGDDYPLPDDIGYSWITINSNYKEKLFLSFQLEIDNSKYIQNLILEDYPRLRFECKEQGAIFIRVPIGPNAVSKASDDCIDRTALFDEFQRLTDILIFLGLDCVSFEDFVDMNYSIPLPINHKGLLNSFITSDSKEIFCSISYATCKLPEWKSLHRKAQEWMLSKNLTVSATSLADFGGMNWFAGFTGCVTPQAYELIRREAMNPQFDSYSGKYMLLEPETWVSREKRRKKLTAPIYQQLGEGILENGVRMVLRLKIVREGYVIYLDFPTDEDMANFEKSELYRMTPWHYGAE